jgi:cyclic nucleotide-binding protein
MSQPVQTDAQEVDNEAFEALFDRAQGLFQEFLAICRAYGIEPAPQMELRRSTGMNSYYYLKDGNIYLAFPRLKGGTGPLYLLFFKQMLDIPSNADILEIFNILLPRLMAHELGHALRHRYNQFDRDNLWLEEQVANQFAMSMIKRRMTPEHKQRVKEALQHAIANLSANMEHKDIALDSYRNVMEALNVSQQISDSMLDSVVLVRNVFSIDTEELLRASGQLPEQVVERIEQREAVIDQMNEQYTKDAARYLYYHLGWMYFDLLGRQSDYVDEFAVTRLGIKHNILPAIEMPKFPERVEIRALYRAYQSLKDRSELGRRFFYKRYRSSLLARLELAQLNVPGGRVESDISQLMEMWEEGQADPLEFLELISPPDVKKLFPSYLNANPDFMPLLPSELPTETDKRLWAYWITGNFDEEVANTVRRLELLDNTPMLRPIPAELQLWLMHRMYRLILDSGDPVLWMGEKNTDLFILTEGMLEILITEPGRGSEGTHVGMIQPGSLFGEYSFITNEASTATVRAVRPSECYVFKGEDLRPMTFNHPTVLTSMAESLAEKLRRANESLAGEHSGSTTVIDLHRIRS